MALSLSQASDLLKLYYKNICPLCGQRHKEIELSDGTTMREEKCTDSPLWEAMKEKP